MILKTFSKLLSAMSSMAYMKRFLGTGRSLIL